MHYVIIGGGICGTTAAEELRKLDANAEITLISEEFHPLYSRVLLPHYLKEKVARDRVFLKKEEWYAEQNIEWMRGVVAQKIDVANQYVGTSDGREIPFDKLLIATGGEVRLHENDMRGVSYFRTLDDADHMLSLLNDRKKTDRAGIFGGGFIACEYLNIFKHFEMPTTIAFRGKQFWTRFLDEESGSLINTHLADNGVRVIPESDIALMGDKTVEGFRTRAGEHTASIVGFGIGINPDLSLISDAGITVEHGVRTNAFLETNAPNVYAAGDIAEFDDPITGRPLMVGNWMNAQMQGRAVAKTMAGEKTEFKLVSSYATNALGLELIFVGDTERTAADEIVVKGSVADGGVAQLLMRDGRLVGATLANRNTDRATVTKLIQSGEKIDPNSIL